MLRRRSPRTDGGLENRGRASARSHALSSCAFPSHRWSGREAGPSPFVQPRGEYVLSMRERHENRPIPATRSGQVRCPPEAESSVGRATGKRGSLAREAAFLAIAHGPWDPYTKRHGWHVRDTPVGRHALQTPNADEGRKTGTRGRPGPTGTTANLFEAGHVRATHLPGRNLCHRRVDEEDRRARQLKKKARGSGFWVQLRKRCKGSLLTFALPLRYCTMCLLVLRRC